MGATEEDVDVSAATEEDVDVSASIEVDVDVEVPVDASFSVGEELHSSLVLQISAAFISSSVSFLPVKTLIMEQVD